MFSLVYKMAWVRVAWKERDHEEGGVVPASWVDIDKKLVFWPNIFNAAKFINERREPADGWKRFILVKVKLRSDDYQQCWDQRSGAVTEGAQCTRRKNKKMQHEDFDYEEEYIPDTDSQGSPAGRLPAAPQKVRSLHQSPPSSEDDDTAPFTRKTP
ncbi:hypothetical protein ABVT39_023614 [Epinephelus coioides]